MKALLSIHDVMPHTLPRVASIIDTLRAQGHANLTLLVVPGKDWQPSDIATLARWQQEGLELAAHGWHHHAWRIKGLRHRLHAALLSRRAGEHLALDGDAIARLMQAAADWFPQHGLASPSTYVPPAWALGAIPRSHLMTLPYQRIEVTRGIIDLQSGQLDKLPLVGFEADTRWREQALRTWNRLQIRQARRGEHPLRLGIHPYDPELRLAQDLQRLVAEPWQALRYDQHRG
ncbi:polysaccharide deacetylase family protein [Halomonas sabkhae]|uniref:polysaccharide deacetylase family protein n=1 Tax=Halomonas sabkhae TaxID=626223 RepID=UPI0025B5FFE3|nr:polysaccharide deacetylase family protein [Halomonas sabkhae]MDN3525265.1 polysaccharide deacetylase family protein [Halomonas sabkhae]